MAMLASIKLITIEYTETFALANGIALGGASFGMMVLPPLTEILVETYGWHSAFLLLGALDLHVIVAGAMIRISEHYDEEEISLLNENKHRHSISNTFLKSLDLNVFRTQPMIIFYDVLITLFSIVFSVWTVYLIPNAEIRGISGQDASLLSTVAGFTNFFGRVASGPIVDIGWVDSRDLFVGVSIINTVIFVADPVFDTYTLMCINAAIAGLSMGAGNNLWTVMVKQFVDECGVSSSFVGTLGWATLFSGVGNIISPLIAGKYLKNARYLLELNCVTSPFLMYTL